MRKVYALLLVLFLACAVAAGWLYWYVITPSPGSGEVTVTIPKGAGVRQIGQLLDKAGLLHYDLRFLVLVKWTDSATRLQAGEFQIARGLPPGEVLEHLRSGMTVQHPVIIPEGLTLVEIAEAFSAQGWGRKARFIALARDPAFLHDHGLEERSAEGYLFPDTYALARGEADEAGILGRMIARFFQVWKTLEPEEATISRHEVVTLASIVEKETGAAMERPMIAAVFFNRLHLGMRLQSDPTVTYGVAGSTGRLTRKDLQRPTPYNTYVIKGLPPGPICNPGRASLQAVLQPDVTNALYFVSKNDGTHHFSRTLKEHNQMVRKYQLSRGKKQ
ncbi:MAG: hypothetical protein CSA34_04720 [Desulfobulbus propionicus]|nr:MAG: hypothetical protein CSA34_04720 [Desulfobulbus propionicus]